MKTHRRKVFGTYFPCEMYPILVISRLKRQLISQLWVVLLYYNFFSFCISVRLMNFSIPKWKNFRKLSLAILRHLWKSASNPLLIEFRQHIYTRISEHMGISPLTWKKHSISTMSGILAHIHTTKHNILRTEFKILSTGISDADLLVRESLYISKLIIPS